jgi:hypothetical protein
MRVTVFLALPSSHALCRAASARTQQYGLGFVSSGFFSLIASHMSEQRRTRGPEGIPLAEVLVMMVLCSLVFL